MADINRKKKNHPEKGGFHDTLDRIDGLVIRLNQTLEELRKFVEDHPVVK